MSDTRLLIEILRDLGQLHSGETYSRQDIPGKEGCWTIDWVGYPINEYLTEAANELERLQNECSGRFS
jgi:hypothetical protein